MDAEKAVVLSGRELKLYNIAEGKLLTKLKGVMNQQMPYFAIQDSDHAIAFSRNRMYVNMVNLTTGDVDATFKVSHWPPNVGFIYFPSRLLNQKIV